MKKLITSLVTILTLLNGMIGQSNNEKGDFVIIGNDTISKDKVLDYKSDTTRHKYLLEDKTIFEKTISTSVKTAHYNHARSSIKTTSYGSNDSAKYQSKSKKKIKVPSSARSRKAIEIIKPKLEKQFTDSSLIFGEPVYIRIFKEEKELEVWVKNGSGFILFKTYPICTYGSGSLGPKIRNGDGQAPTGFYYVKPSQLNPWSSYHLSFNLGYPNAYDRAHERTGSAIMVHGDCVSIGCYAMTNDGIEEIYTIVDAALSNGQSFFRVHIFPFKMTDQNMENHNNSDWYSMWKNLKVGYGFFEDHNNPPNVGVSDSKYIFN